MRLASHWTALLSRTIRFGPSFVVQFLIFLLASMILARGAIEILDRLTFDPDEWGMDLPVLSKMNFQKALADRASSIENEGFCPDYRFRFRQPDWGDGGGKEFIAWNRPTSAAREAEVIVLRRTYVSELAEEIACEDEVRSFAHKTELDPERLIQGQNGWAVAVSAYSSTMGLRHSHVNRDALIALCKQLDCEGDSDSQRWVQAIIDASGSAVRVNTLVSGPIQEIMYVFLFMTVLLVVVEGYVIRTSARTAREWGILPILEREVHAQHIQRLVNKIRGLRMQRSVPEDILPNVTYDFLEPGYKALLSYSGPVNSAEVHTILESAGQSVLEKMSCRYQIMRYFVLSIPSLGFIGTVLGIGRALGVTSVMISDASVSERLLANYMLSGNLHIAFDTTLVGLVLSILLGFVVDILETREVNFILKTKKRVMEILGNVRELILAAPDGVDISNGDAEGRRLGRLAPDGRATAGI